ncbi:hypothetical protein NDU88_004813 [Pleurodeles waltl]|uniref:Uncharacterized protein n=1 Tax=Pleurodeles waltl TaxID=8319 RepID=A0AAV7T9J8_PLEWA|nr:hypothetical protein NDU88_004813 [Pleurodeles waltl]
MRPRCRHTRWCEAMRKPPVPCATPVCRPSGSCVGSARNVQAQSRKDAKLQIDEDQRSSANRGRVWYRTLHSQLKSPTVAGTLYA